MQVVKYFYWRGLSGDLLAVDITKYAETENLIIDSIAYSVNDDDCHEALVVFSKKDPA